MRSAKLYRAISATAAMLAFSATSRADFSYNFDNLTGTPNPGTPLVGSSTVGTVGQDNWIHTSGTQVPTVRNDAITPEQVIDMRPAALVLSPGPCTPSEAGCSLRIESLAVLTEINHQDDVFFALARHSRSHRES